MSSLYIGFSYPKKFRIGAWVISKWLGKPYSHVYIKFESDTIPNTIYHAANGMVHFMEENNFKSINHIIKEIKLPPSATARKVILTHAIYLAGVKYGYIELLKIFISDVCTFLNCPIFKSYNGAGYICSELVAEVLKDYYGIQWDKPHHLIKPNDIEEVLDGKT